jgi:surface polysaccharide O-acyltransferase-like enzyme
MSENLQKKLPIVMLVLLILASIIEGISTYYANPEVQNIVNIGHLILAVLVLIIGLSLVYVKFLQKKKEVK